MSVGFSERAAVSDMAINLMKMHVYGDSSRSFSIGLFVRHSLYYVSTHCLLVFPLLPRSVRVAPQFYKYLL